MTDLKKTPLTDWHIAQGAKMAEFAGYNMPIQYTKGIIAEHTWVRENAGLFDVSHMGQVILEGENVRPFLQHITPSNFMDVTLGECTYTVFTNDNGGVIDDLIAMCLDENSFLLTINAGNKDKDLKWLQENLMDGIDLVPLNRAIIALQGPKAIDVMLDLLPGAPFEDLPYMFGTAFELGGADILLSRSGYTGEDGFELSMPPEAAPYIWDALMENDNVEAIGLGARDSLRLEAGFPLCGHDLDETTSPVEGTIKWILRKEDLEHCIGAKRIINELKNKPSRKRIGFELIDKGVAREGSEIYTEDGTTKIGVVTSGGHSPTFKKSIGLAYVETAFKSGQDVLIDVRGRKLKAKLHKTRFYKATDKAKEQT